MIRITDAERRARVGARHHLATPGPGVAEVAGDLCGLHATDPATIFLAARARLGAEAGTVPAVERALYDEGRAVRILGMRRTMFVVPPELVPVIHGACTQRLVPGERRRFVAHLETGGVAEDGERWLRETQAATLAALGARGEATTAELGTDVPALRESVLVAEGKKYEARQGVASQVLFLLAAEGRIVRGRPLGSWTSTLNRWALAPRAALDAPEVAGADLVRRWLRAFGPGTFADIKWWTGWTAGLLKQVLAEVRPAEVGLDGGGTGLVLPGGEAPAEAAPAPWVALLPALDPTTMGWAGRDFYLGPHRPVLFDRNGNAGPTIWSDGRVVGGWAQREDGEVVTRLLEDVGAEVAAAVEAEAASVQAWTGGVRVIPRFRTPLERELTA